MIHGGGGTAAAAERTYGWDAEADSGQFIVAYPDGLDHAWAVGSGCCSTPGRTDVNDVGFISQLVSTVSHEAPIDSKRVYVTGISEGGMLAYRLACQTTIFAAIGPDSATLLGRCPSPPAISVIHIHGTADQRIPYNGGPGAGVNHIDGPAIPALNAMWRSVDRCAAPSTSTAGVVTKSVAACPDGRAVELITVAGAGHQWPGGVCGSRCSLGLTDPPSTALNATQTIWQFFAEHQKSPCT
jgi:polyhydroxybutyrate depolymerase